MPNASQGSKAQWERIESPLRALDAELDGESSVTTGGNMPVNTITPQLRTTDLDASIRFYTEQVGLQLDFRHSDFYAGIRSGGGGFHLKRVDTADPSVTFVQEGRHLHLYLGVDDVDAFGERLRAKGVDLVQPPCDTAWGTRELVFRDDQGHTIYAGMRVAPASE